MPNYGLGVSVATALPRVIPEGWAVKVHPSTRIDGVLSWQPGDAWTSVLAKWAAKTDVSVVLDWDAKVVYLQPGALGAEFFKTLAAEKATYKTPLPNFGAKYSIQTRRTPSNLFTYTGPESTNRPQARVVAQSIADKYRLVLVWVAPEYQLEGPVTLLGQNAAEDAELLWKASGRDFSPVAYEVVGNVLLAYPQGQRDYALAELSIKQLENPDIKLSAGAAAPVTAKAESNTAHGGSTHGAQADAGTSGGTRLNTTPEAQPSAGDLVLTIKAGQQVEVVLARFARSLGYTFEWKVEGGFQAQRDMEFRGPRLAVLLEPLVEALGVSADVYTADKHLVVRGLEPKDY